MDAKIREAFIGILRRKADKNGYVTGATLGQEIRARGLQQPVSKHGSVKNALLKLCSDVIDTKDGNADGQVWYKLRRGLSKAKLAGSLAPKPQLEQASVQDIASVAEALLQRYVNRWHLSTRFGMALKQELAAYGLRYGEQVLKLFDIVKAIPGLQFGQHPDYEYALSFRVKSPGHYDGEVPVPSSMRGPGLLPADTPIVQAYGGRSGGGAGGSSSSSKAQQRAANADTQPRVPLADDSQCTQAAYAILSRSPLRMA